MAKKSILSVFLAVFFVSGGALWADVSDNPFGGSGTKTIADGQSSSEGLVLTPAGGPLLSYGGYNTSAAGTNPARYRNGQIHRFDVNSYFLTVFDLNSGDGNVNVATAVVAPTAIELTVGNNNNIRHLVRDACEGTWYASDVVPMGIDGAGYSLDVSTVNWVALPESGVINDTIADGTATFPSTLTFTGTAGAIPAKIDGGGVYYEQGSPSVQGFLWTGADTSCSGGNVAPSVSAGDDVTVNINALPFELAGNAFDLDGPDDVTVVWSVVSGPDGAVVTFDPADANAVDATVTMDMLGVYELQLEAFDGADAASDTILIDVVSNDPPVVTIYTESPVTLYYDEILAVDANVIDDGKPVEPGVVTMLWEVTAGVASNVIIEGSTEEDPNVLFADIAAAGDYTLTLTADDGALQSSASIDFTVLDNVEPTVEGGADAMIALSEGGTLTLAGVVDDDGYPKSADLLVGWSVAVGEAANVTFDPGADAVDAVATFSEVGDYVLELAADDGAAVVSDSILVTVTPSPVERIVLGAVDDTYVRSNREGWNLGTSDDVRVQQYKGYPDSHERYAYMQFDIYGNVPGAVQSAKLRLKSNDAMVTTRVSAITYGLSGDWYEGNGVNEGDDGYDGGLTWNSDDLVWGEVLDQISPITADWFEFDVAGMVLEADGQATFGLDAPDENGTSKQWRTKEHNDAPELVILYDPNMPYRHEPVEGQIEVHPAGTFSWVSAPPSKVDSVYLGTDPDNLLLDGTIDAVTDPNGTIYDPAGLAELEVGATYYWQVVGDSGNAGPVLSFTVMQIHPNLPILISPVGNAEELVVPDEIIFEWADSEVADVGHNLYVSTDLSEVEALSPNARIENAISPFDPNGFVTIALDATLYWAVEGVSSAGGSLVSEIRSFTTTNYEYVDGFESGVWPGGVVEPIRIDDGSGAMRVAYEGGSASATKTFNAAQDWSAASGREALSLSLHGSETNAGEAVYVSLSDGVNSGRVYYDDPTELIQKSFRPFMTWHIDLDDFSDVDLSSVESITVGVEGTGTGYIIVDEVYVYAMRCLAGFAVNDLTGDCVTDVDDMLVLADNWLTAEKVVSAESVSTAGLLGYWEFEDNLDDSSGHGWTLTNNGVTFVEGLDGSGKAIDCASVGDAISAADGEPGDASDIAGSISNEASVSFWAKANLTVDPDGKLPNSNFFRLNHPDLNFYVRGPNRSGSYGWAGWGSFMGGLQGTDEEFAKWTHFAFVVDAVLGRRVIYVDGVLKSVDYQAKPWDGSKATLFSIGQSYHGAIDDFMLFDRVLSQGEVVSLAGLSSVVQPVVTNADIDEDGSVDLGDYARMAGMWLGLDLWPN